MAKLAKYEKLPELLPVIAFYKQNRIMGIEKALMEFEIVIFDEKNRKGNIGFRIQSEGIRIHEKPEVLKKIIAEYEIEQKKSLVNTRKTMFGLR